VRLLAREDEEVALEEPVEPPAAAGARHAWAWSLGVAAFAALPRLLYLFVFSDPENPGVRRYGDVWHHWQIAYLTQQVGLTAPDGPRLWDLKGLEYFWGILHPLLMVAIFDLTGSIDIVLDRLVSLAFGVIVAVILFHVCRRHWGMHVALAAALIASLLPTSVMNDASGMLEPLGVALCLAGLVAWPRRGFWSGLAFGLATMARAEAWVFGAGMVVAAFFKRDGVRQRIPLLAGFIVVMLVYMKILADKTGNAVYPLWWNFLANAVGKWEFTPVTSGQASVRPVLGVLLLLAFAGLVWSLVRRPPAYMLLTFGFGYWVFVAGMLGFTSYLASWVWWMPVTRVFAFPYVFAGVLLAVIALWWAPRRFGSRVLPFGWAAVAAALLASQLAWIPIHEVFGPSEAEWEQVKAESVQLGAWYNTPGYAGHLLAVPSDRPDITYGLARYGGVEGKHLISEMYVPFDFTPGYWPEERRTEQAMLAACWFEEKDVRLIAVNQSLELMVSMNPTWFSYLGTMDEAKWKVYAIGAPAPAPAECAPTG
jgi:Dolichyl-phosphate-mannose-protein mannosyltransferase